MRTVSFAHALGYIRRNYSTDNSRIC